jgi:hypothetical protein
VTCLQLLRAGEELPEIAVDRTPFLENKQTQTSTEDLSCILLVMEVLVLNCNRSGLKAMGFGFTARIACYYCYEAH